MSANYRPRRSVMFLPGVNAKALEVAETISADVLVFDLEDAVTPDQKETARRMTADAVADREYGGKELVIRINGLDTKWAAADIAAVTPVAPDGILVPKVCRGEDIRRLRAALRAAGADQATKIWAMMETPQAILNAAAIADSGREQGPELAAFVIGTNDLAAETEVRPAKDRSPMIPWLSACVLAGRANDLAVIDGIYNDFNDEAGFFAECAQSRMLGMDGKSLIHPNQVGRCNMAFMPSAEEIDWARGVIAAFDDPVNSGMDVVSYNGRSLERMHARIARRMLTVAQAGGGNGLGRRQPATSDSG